MGSARVRELQNRSRKSEVSEAALFSWRFRRTLPVAVLLIIVTMVVYSPVVHNAFVNFDDDDYILGTPQIRQSFDWNLIRWAFTTFAQANWHPLTWLSHALDYQLFPSNPGAVHLESVFIHALTAALLFLLLQDVTGSRWKSLMVGALYAFHPLNVESVAWASERKTVLCMFFFMLALWAYSRYTQRRTIGRYLAVMAAFALGLMAKPQIVTLPFVLLLWDIWPLGRLKRSGSAGRSSVGALIAEKIPLFALSAASSIVTLRAQAAGGAINDWLSSPLSLRLANAVVSYARYLGKAIWPSKLAVLYLFPVNGLPAWQVVAAMLLLLTVSAVVFMARRHSYLAVGWLWFLGTLVPMIGLVQVGQAAMADRYACLPLIGLFLMVVWGVSDIVTERKINGPWVAITAGLALLLLAVATYRQVGYWQDGETLWTHAAAVTNNNFVAQDNLGVVLLAKGHGEQAIQHFHAAFTMQPQDAISNLYIGLYEGRHGNHQLVVDHLTTALSHMGEKNADWKEMAYANLGTAYRNLRNYPEARRCFEAALSINSANTVAEIGMGLIAERQKNYSEAVHWYSEAMQKKPSAVSGLLLSNALRENGKPEEAKEVFQKAQDLATDFSASMSVVDQMLMSIEKEQ